MKSNKSESQQVACQACYLLNQAIRELSTPKLVIELSKKWLQLDPVPWKAIAAVQNMANTSMVVNIFRLKEAQDHFLVGWLFTEEELRSMGFPPIEEFIGGPEKWKSFEVVRNQYAGHATSHKATRSKPGRIISAPVLGMALRQTGLWEMEAFLNRVQEELVPGVERVHNKLLSLYPNAQEFINKTYPKELEIGAKGEG